MTRSYHLSAAEVKRIVRLRQKNYSIDQIARKTKRSSKTVCQVLDRAGVPRRRVVHRSPPPVPVETVVELRGQGLLLREVGERVGLSAEEAAKLAHRHGATPYDVPMTRICELAGDLGLTRDALYARIEAGDFAATRYGIHWMVTPEQEAVIRAHYAQIKSPVLYAHWLSKEEAAAILGVRPRNVLRLEGLTPVQVYTGRYPAYRYNPEEVHALAARRRAQRRAA